MVKYIIRNGMKLNCKIPIDKKKPISKVVGMFKRNTNIPTPGVYTINKTENVFNISYTLNEGIGTYEASLKTLNSDETVSVYDIDFKVRGRNKPNFYLESLTEEYFEEEARIIKTIKCTLNDGNIENFRDIICTKLVVSSTDRNLNVSKRFFNLTPDKPIIEFSTHDNMNIRAEAITKYFFTEDNRKIYYIDSAKLTITKSPSYIGPDYISVHFTDFINKNTENDIDIKEYYYYKINNRASNVFYDEEEAIKVPAYGGFDQPSKFFTKETQIPEIPIDEIFENPINKNIDGDAFSNTRAHNEFSPNGSRSIKVGKTVPPNAVNLAYYYNKTATFDNALSVVETNSNSITLKRMEQWSHKRRLQEKSDDVFYDTVEFNGEPGTEFEGYWGILYKEKVIWDEEIDLDQEQEYVSFYKDFNGLRKNKAPITLEYNDGVKFGTLTLVHAIYQANYFEKDLNNQYINGYSPRNFLCNAKYDGFIKVIKTFYNASCKYSGIITKKDGMSNLDPEQPRELLMYPNNLGILEDYNGNSKVDDDLFLITDKFCDGEPLYYKHKLKYQIYNSIGFDKYGKFNSDNIKLVFSNGIEINKDKYKYKFVLVPTQNENIYHGYVYTNFMTTFDTPIYVLYDAVIERSKEYSLDVTNKVGIKEKLSLVEAIDRTEYEVSVEEGLTRQSTIKFYDFSIFEDRRNKIKLKYYIEAEGLKSKVMTFDLISKKYALTEELKDFRDDSLIISPKTNNGYLTARDILFDNIDDEDKRRITKDSIFKAIYYTEDSNTRFHKDKGILYTNVNGNDVVYVKSYFDTGMPSDDSETPTYDRILDASNIYISRNGFIHKGFSIKCKNINQIVISSPKEKNPLKGWFPKVRYSYFSKVYERIDKTIQLIYSVPEFFTQVFGKYGAPFIDIKDERARIIGTNTIKTNNAPLYISQNLSWEPDSISVYKVGIDDSRKELSIKSFDYINGIIELEDSINDNDNVFINYTYEEKYYHYKGYYRDGDKNSKLININLNPSIYSKYTDTKNELYDDRQCYDLFNRTVHFFLRPTRVIDKETGEVITDNKFTLYHKFDNQIAEGPFDLHIGRIFIRHHASLKSTEIIDTRSRGGGILEEIKDSLRKELEPESDFYLDIGTLDGDAYQANSVIVIKLHNKLLKVNGGKYTEDEVREAVHKWCAVGTFPIIEFVEVIEDMDIPQNTMVVNKHISNKIDYVPELKVEVVYEE